MRIVVTGASGNIGTSVVRVLRGEHEVVGLARRAAPSLGIEWHALDVARDDLGRALRGADAIIHLAWAINPSRRRAELRRVNVEGTVRVCEAAAAAGVGAVVHASSIGAYAPGPKDRLVDESWPTTGIPGFAYSEDKVAVERYLDAFERRAPDVRVVRMRPALVLKPEAASHLRRELVGAWLPSPLVHPRLLRVLPRHPRLRVQIAHSDDVALAFRAAALDDGARGAFNLAADPVVDGPAVAQALGAVTVPFPARLLKPLHQVAHLARIVPGEPGWTDETLGSPLVDAGRARRELGWSPAVPSVDALVQTLAGLARSAGAPTPPLDASAGGPLRLRELAGSAGARFSN
jgi:UDP-glucose 4-epimerase